MSTRKNRVAAFLAVASLVGFLAMFGFLAVKGVPEANKDYIDMCLIALIGFVGTAFGYYLGSSEGSSRKTDLMAPAPDFPLALLDAEATGKGEKT